MIRQRPWTLNDVGEALQMPTEEAEQLAASSSPTFAKLPCHCTSTRLGTRHADPAPWYPAS